MGPCPSAAFFTILDEYIFYRSYLIKFLPNKYFFREYLLKVSEPPFFEKHFLKREPMRYLHAAVRVSNLDASLHFYCDLLGLVVLRRNEHVRSRYTGLKLAAPGDMPEAESRNTPLLEIVFNWDEENYSNGRNFGHLAFDVDNIYDVCQRFLDAGVPINRPPRDGYMAFVKSPDGVSIELLQKSGALPIKEPWASMKNISDW